MVFMGYQKEFLIAYEDLEQLCPGEMGALESAINAAALSTDLDNADLWVILATADADSGGDKTCVVDNVANLLTDEHDLTETVAADAGQALAKLLVDLKEAFTQRTGELGLQLRPLSMDADFGDFVRPPVVNPPLHAFVFVVENMVGLTPAGERFKHVVAEYEWFDE
jgi:hypothetical protein